MYKAKKETSVFPKISVIVPVFNAASTIKRCVNSILAQSNTDFELLLIDDGSKDNSLEICNEYADCDSRIRVYHKENGGASSARNLGLSHMKGEWVTFVDIDDEIEESYFDVTGFDSVDLIIQRWRFSNSPSTNEPINSSFLRGNDFVHFMEDNLCKDVMRMVAAKLLKADIIRDNQIVFPEDIKLGEDTLFMITYYRYIDSLSINNTGHYIYYRDDNWGSKYHITIQEISHYFESLLRVYKELPFDCGKFLKFIFYFYIQKLDKLSILDKLRLNVKPSVIQIKEELIRQGEMQQTIFFRVFSVFNK